MGIGGDYNSISNFTNDINTDFYWSMYLKAGSQTNWPNRFQKMMEFPFSVFYVQPQNGIAARDNPTNFILLETLPASRTTSFRLSAERDGGQMDETRWYFFSGHSKRNSPTDFFLKVDRSTRLAMSPRANTTSQAQFSIGLINACSTDSWNSEMWMDQVTTSTQEIFAPAEIWGCPTDDDASDGRGMRMVPSG